MLDNVEINWTDPSLGPRLRAAYWAAHGLKPPERRPVSRALRLRDLMTALFAAGRLDQYRLRST